VCGATHVTIAALFCSSSPLCISNSDWATENEAGRSVSVNGNEECAGENCHWYILVVSAVTPYSCTTKLQYILRGDYWECAACPNPRLNLSSELRHSWEQHLRYVPHRMRNGYKRERSSILCNTHISCLVNTTFIVQAFNLGKRRTKTFPVTRAWVSVVWKHVPSRIENVCLGVQSNQYTNCTE